jgi:Lon protease-like protein
MSLVEMPLFPLNTVLFPGGNLPLRIFEPRYLSMIGSCMKRGEGFGVMLIAAGQEAGTASDFHAVGTSASVVDFDQLDDGMLGVTCRGGRRIRVISHDVQPDQLIVAEVETLEEITRTLPAQYIVLQTFLRELIKREEAEAYRQWLKEDWDNATWIGYRLAELLPLTLSSKQALLEMDPLQRLEVLHSVMQENQLI